LIRDAIERLRLKLLDLTNRNRLLNFKFTDASKKYVRIVDEIPGHLYDRLTSDNVSYAKLYLASLPEPPDQSIESSTKGLIRSAASIAVNADGKSTDAEAALKTGAARFSIEQWARDNGIDPSYDLPEKSILNLVGKHVDNQLQTLLLPEPLARKMARIRDDARLSEQEQGTSTLYAAFGFLEWYEDPRSKEARYAPLFLLPVQLSREIKGQQYRYFIECGEGADPVSNISLRERLRNDFHFVLPELGEDQNPEDYLATVREAIKAMPHWRVRRFVVIGHFSFARLAMYEDLNSAKWAASPLEAQVLIRDLLAGAETAAADSYAEDFETESERVEKLVPTLILDADSSQYSAIVDAMQGRSFALKGPPGTGKSQTITNLIAAAIGANKRVLFVAEKLTALEVVSKRLTEAGLGPFILELHSTKVQKKKVAESFAERLEIRRPSIADVVSGKEHLDDLKQVRGLLHRYAGILNNPVGRSSLSLHDILWHEQRSRKDLSEPEYALSSGTLGGDQTQKTPAQVFSDLETLRTLTSGVTAAVASAGALSDHPLYGLQELSTDRREHDQTRQTLKALDTTVQGLDHLGERLKSPLRVASGASLGALSNFSQRLLAIPVPNAVSTELLSLIRTPADAAQATQLIDRAYAASVQVTRLEPVLDDVYAGLAAAAKYAEQAQRLRELAQRFEWGDTHLDAARSSVQNEESELQRMRTLLRRIGQWATQLDLVPPLRIDQELRTATVESLVAALDLLHQTPTACLRQRDPRLFRTEARAQISKAKTIFEELKREEQTLQEHALLSFQENPKELIAAAHVIEQASLATRLFSGAYRKAKQVYQTLSRDRWHRPTAAARLQVWATAIQRRQAFDNDSTLRQEIGPAFVGMQTPFDVLTGTVDFWEKVRAHWPSLDEERGKIQRELLKADSAKLEDASSSFSANDLQLLKVLPSWNSSGDVFLVEDVLLKRSTQLGQARGALETLTRIPWRRPVTVEGGATHCQGWARLAAMTRELAQSPLQVLVFPNARLPGPAELTRLRATAAFATSTLGSQLPHEATQQLLSPRDLEGMRDLQQYATTMTRATDKIRELIHELQRQAGLALEDWTGGATLDAADVTLLQQRSAAAAAASPESYDDWAALCEARRELTERGAGALATAVVRGEMPAHRAEQCYRRLYYRSLIQAVNEHYPESRAWTGTRLHHARSRLVELDLAHIKSGVKSLIQTLALREVPVGVSRGAKKDLTERSLIENEVGKQTRHIPIRALLARAFHAAQALKPCFMMSPASVSQFLSQVSGAFDLVVIDEASQMRPEDALATLARGKQIVVVGDPMQLPPTTFFDAVQDENTADEDDDELAVDTESVLDLALSKLRPARDLRWHYRSRHESLIAFSNREFYRDRLIVFPSPIAKAARLGVQYSFVADGLYKSSINPNEAAEVVKIVAGLIHENPNRSIGVVAVNQPQRDLLTAEFDRLFPQDDALEAYRARWEHTLEDFFVHNLENVQGHERDVIVISTVYGPETPGSPPFQRFPTINSKVGHRRLNVLFTRAKELVVLVTSLKSEDIKELPTSSPGVIALKHYLEFARSGRLDSGKHTGRSPDSPFEAEVADVLTQLGHRVQAQVGVAGFFIDMAVRHPARHDHYVLGIECDGATYHSAKSARDRDRLRQEILERLGWKLHRIWSTDWYHSRDREVARLKQAVNSAIDSST
jgi:very-short-patch-repair endonuclease